MPHAVKREKKNDFAFCRVGEVSPETRDVSKGSVEEDLDLDWGEKKGEKESEREGETVSKCIRFPPSQLTMALESLRLISSVSNIRNRINRIAILRLYV